MSYLVVNPEDRFSHDVAHLDFTEFLQGIVQNILFGQVLLYSNKK